ncbi:GT2 family glycosyltransferase [Algoriphagus iocasae]|uniref:GT2 family glycosyltransferase n=1 Tax=Algoriphagus iocasae TaxID=1836499 RepID=A0A841MT56_9BACT|nr:glycosyltransferase [Algoriphagus iocasae]MBB6327824.1 GT2 family glycosyltransferase [Algoriphagus iocasae]
MIKFGGFIITYNRPEILRDTISKIFAQTYPPEVLWVIDNSESLATDYAIASLQDSRIRYYRMGYNAGPAGAAAKGLEICGKEGLDWIYWGDDNDPPFRVDCFERLLDRIDVNPFVGVIGAMGQFFDRKKGVVKRIQTRLLEKKETIEVDYVAGGKCMLINGSVARDGICPNPDLFFGFEELDFCLKVCRKGYIILVDCKLFLEERTNHKRLNFERPNYQKKENLSREYYSLRNLLYISDNLTLNSMKNKLVLKWLAKSIYGFRYGFRYGFSNFKFIMLAFYHYLKGIKGKTIDV